MPLETLTLEALRGVLRQRRIVNSNLINLARALFKAGIIVRYNVVNGQNMIVRQYGEVKDVEQEGSEVYVVVLPDRAKKTRRVLVDHIVGVMPEA